MTNDFFEMWDADFGYKIRPDAVVAIQVANGERTKKRDGAGPLRKCKIRRTGDRYFFRLLKWTKPNRVKFDSSNSEWTEPAVIVHVDGLKNKTFRCWCSSNAKAKLYFNLYTLRWKKLLENK